MSLFSFPCEEEIQNKISQIILIFCNIYFVCFFSNRSISLFFFVWKPMVFGEIQKYQFILKTRHLLTLIKQIINVSGRKTFFQFYLFFETYLFFSSGCRKTTVVKKKSTQSQIIRFHVWQRPRKIKPRKSSHLFLKKKGMANPLAVMSNQIQSNDKNKDKYNIFLSSYIYIYITYQVQIK